MTTYPPLDGGTAAWMAASGSFLTHLIMALNDKSFGHIIVHLRRTYPEASVVALSSIVSVNFSVASFVGPIVAALINKGMSPRQILIVSGLLECISCVAAAYSSSFYAIFLLYGIGLGVAYGASWTTAVTVVNQYFESRRSLALALCLSGNGVGGFVVPPMINYFIEEFGLHGAFLLTGGVALNVVLAGALCRPIADNYDAATLENRNQMALSKTETDSIASPDSINGTAKAKNVQRQCCVQPTICNGRSGLNLELFFNPVFLLYISASAIGMPCVWWAPVFLPSLMLENNFTSQESAFILSAMFISCFVAFLVVGSILNCPVVARRRHFVFVIVILFSSAFDFLAPFLRSYSAFFIYGVFRGVNDGAYVMLRTLVLVDLMGRDRIPDLIGLLHFVLGVGAILVPLGSAQFVDVAGSYDAAFFYDAAAQGMACLLLTLSLALNSHVSALMQAFISALTISHFWISK